jgi:hypothetical protein
MTDYDLRPYGDCDSIKTFEQQVDGYTVRHCMQPPSKSFQYDFECTCEEYKKNPYRYCEHIKKVEHELCGWSQMVHGCEPINNGNGDYRCPNCGESVTLSRYAV